jgi:dolichol-phosphate mannosyltransferase
LVESMNPPHIEQGDDEARSPCVSVVIPCYNEAATIASVIRSVLARHEVHEVIVVDDGSRDGTWTLLERLAAEDARIRTIQHDLILKPW